MPVNYDKLAFFSQLPAFKNKDSGSLTITVSGTVGVSATQTWTGSATFSANNRMVRYMMQQTPVPTTHNYTQADRVPIALMNSGADLAPWFSCGVSGNASVHDAAASIYVSSSSGTVTATIAIHNPYSGTMTLTSTTVTIYYTAFETFGES